jgi:hypothetical protein
VNRRLPRWKAETTAGQSGDAANGASAADAGASGAGDAQPTSRGESSSAWLFSRFETRNPVGDRRPLPVCYVDH